MNTPSSYSATLVLLKTGHSYCLRKKFTRLNKIMTSISDTQLLAGRQVGHEANLKQNASKRFGEGTKAGKKDHEVARKEGLAGPRHLLRYFRIWFHPDLDSRGPMVTREWRSNPSKHPVQCAKVTRIDPWRVSVC